MRFFDINLVTVLVRFYLMMAAVIVGLFTGLNWLAFLALPIFLSIMLGVTFRKESKRKTSNTAVKTTLSQRTAA